MSVELYIENHGDADALHMRRVTLPFMPAAGDRFMASGRLFVVERRVLFLDEQSERVEAPRLVLMEIR